MIHFFAYIPLWPHIKHYEKSLLLCPVTVYSLISLTTENVPHNHNNVNNSKDKNEIMLMMVYQVHLFTVNQILSYVLVICFAIEFFTKKFYYAFFRIVS